MKFEVIFDLVQSGYRDAQTLELATALLALGIFLVYNRIALAKFYLNAILAKVIPWTFLSFSAFSVILIVQFSFLPYLTFHSALVDKDYSVVEGTITDFSIAATKRGTHGQFAVGSIKFEFGNYFNDVGLRVSSVRGTDIHDGMMAKIFYHEGVILRLEVTR